MSLEPKCVGLTPWGGLCPIAPCGRYIPKLDFDPRKHSMLRPAWCHLPHANPRYPGNACGMKSSCMDWTPEQVEKVEPHGGAAEEGDGA